MVFFSALQSMLLATLVVAALGHGCSDGSRVVCSKMTATSLLAAPASTGSKDAKGFPLQSPHDGKTLYCLVHHSYHQCASDEAACCSDGSKPAHEKKKSGFNFGILVGLCACGWCVTAGFLACCIPYCKGKGKRVKAVKPEQDAEKADAISPEQGSPVGVEGIPISPTVVVADCPEKRNKSSVDDDIESVSTVATSTPSPEQA